MGGGAARGRRGGPRPGGAAPADPLHPPGPGTSADAIAALLDGVRATGADGCVVALQQSVDSPDEALELGVEVLDLLRG
ncbi:hypothetical protein [Streptomyces sp. NPDC047974]|uniref:hypothetical protein n=1 Tax=Streptomyces sp. NPDC047974 TaxID=3154343 RepID=UPI0033E24494